MRFSGNDRGYCSVAKGINKNSAVYISNVLCLHVPLVDSDPTLRSDSNLLLVTWKLSPRNGRRSARGKDRRQGRSSRATTEHNPPREADWAWQRSSIFTDRDFPLSSLSLSLSLNLPFPHWRGGTIIIRPFQRRRIYRRAFDDCCTRATRYTRRVVEPARSPERRLTANGCFPPGQSHRLFDLEPTCRRFQR